MLQVFVCICQEKFAPEGELNSCAIKHPRIWSPDRTPVRVTKALTCPCFLLNYSFWLWVNKNQSLHPVPKKHTNNERNNVTSQVKKYCLTSNHFLSLFDLTYHVVLCNTCFLSVICKLAKNPRKLESWSVLIHPLLYCLITNIDDTLTS